MNFSNLSAIILQNFPISNLQQNLLKITTLVQGWEFWVAWRQCRVEIFCYDAEVCWNSCWSFFYFPKIFQLIQEFSWKFSKFSRNFLKYLENIPNFLVHFQNFLESCLNFFEHFRNFLWNFKKVYEFTKKLRIYKIFLISSAETFRF